MFKKQICGNKNFKIFLKNFFFSTIKNKKYNNPQNYKYKIDHFNPNQSKYALQADFQTPPNIPKYLENYKDIEKKDTTTTSYSKIKDNVRQKDLKSGKRMKLPKIKRNKSLTKEDKLVLREEKENIKLLPSNTVDRNDLQYISQQKQMISTQLTQLKREALSNRRKISFESLLDLNVPEKLSKRLARLGVSSRKQADKLIKLGYIKVDGEIVQNNIEVDQNTQIQVFTGGNIGFKTPVPQNTKLWLFHKPVGIMSTYDKTSRKNVYDFLSSIGFGLKHYHIIGKLDVNSQGLMIITNNSDIAISLENNKTILRGYKVRVFGRMFTEDKLIRIREGVRVNGKVIKFWCEVIRKQNTNTWIHLKSNSNSISDIRNIFSRLSLRVNRLIRTDYGPFTIGKVSQPGKIVETYIPKNINNYLMYRYKEKIQNSIRKIDDAKLEYIKLKLLQDQRLISTESKNNNKLN